MSELVLDDAESLQDLGRYAARARAVDADGAMRLQAVGPVLAAWVCVLPGSGLMGEGTALGLRTSALAEEVDLDVTVPLAAISDRVARPGERAVLPVPPMTLSPAWAAVSPPRSGWNRVGLIDADTLRDNATRGIAQVADGTPDGAGAHAVTALRERVWSQPIAASDIVRAPGGDDATGAQAVASVPAGLAFAAYALGFIVPRQMATIAQLGRWTRLSTPAGHALMRT